jgi:hypothetical protein
MKKFSSLALLSLLFIGSLITALPVKAIDIPDFPSCNSPTGSVKVSYDTGIHGIPGDSGEYVGSDVVYTVSDTQLTQCFCAVSGSGIQTNWWKDGSMSAEQVSYLKNLGWIYIADGSAWGLESSAYMAKNTTFNCGGEPEVTPTPTPATPTPTGAPQPCNNCGGASTWVCTAAKPGTTAITSVVRSGTTAQLTWTAADKATHYVISYGPDAGNLIYGVPNTGNVTSYVIGSLQPGVQYHFVVRAVNDCMPGDLGQVLGASTGFGGQVLAATGSWPEITTLLASGLVFLGLSVVTYRKSREN